MSFIKHIFHRETIVTPSMYVMWFLASSFILALAAIAGYGFGVQPSKDLLKSWYGWLTWALSVIGIITEYFEYKKQVNLMGVEAR